MRLGLHVPRGQTIDQAVARAAELGCTALQVFTRNPRAWAGKRMADQEVADFRAARRETDMWPVVVHSPYLTNLASPNRDVRVRSQEAIRLDYAETIRLGAEYFVLHPGSVVEADPAVGRAQVVRELKALLAEVEGETLVLLENTAGGGGALGACIEELGRLYGEVARTGRIGLCVDTAHLFAAGYDLRKPEEVTRVVGEVEAVTGLDALRLIHLNDSKASCGSHLDRHEHIGEGTIGAEGLGHVINHPWLRDLPFILETPKAAPEDDRRNLVRVLALRQPPR